MEAPAGPLHKLPSVVVVVVEVEVVVVLERRLRDELRLLKVGLFWGLCLGDLAGEALGDLLLRRLPPEALLPRRAHPRVPPEPTEAKDEHRSNSDGVLEVLFVNPPVWDVESADESPPGVRPSASPPVITICGLVVLSLECEMLLPDKEALLSFCP